MKPSRLLSISWQEVSDRSKQAAFKRLDRAGILPREKLRVAAQPEKFFAGANRETVEVIAARYPEASANTVAVARRLLEGRFDLLGYQGLDFGTPVDWHFDPVSRRHSPRVHWTRLDPLDAETVGDHKVIWELSRHQWLLTLLQAAAITGDASFVQRAAGLLTEWLDDNPTGQGINWTSSLEVAYRLISWCWAWPLLADHVTSAELARLRQAMTDHALHIERYPSHYFSPNTHLTGEALALVYAGAILGVDRWADFGARILNTECARQIHSDGVYFEQSTTYQRYTIEIYLHFMLLADQLGMRLPETIEARVRAMLGHLIAVRLPDGNLPQIGDNDGGHLPGLTLRETVDPAGIFSVAAAYLAEGRFKWAAGEATPDVLWLLGTGGLERFDAVEAIVPEALTVSAYPEGGYAILRSDWSANAHQVILDAGPLGGLRGGHGHADLLSVQCTAFGEPIIVDPGTYVYAGPGADAWREAMRNTSAHSTVLVNGRNQDDTAGPFGWRRQPSARLTGWEAGEEVSYAAGTSLAYSHKGAVLGHERRVYFVDSEYWVLVDDVFETGRHHIELRFQFGAEIQALLEDKGWTRCRGMHSLWLKTGAPVSLARSLHCGEVAPIQGWHAPRYGQRREASVLSLETTADLPLRLMTVMVPVRNPGAPAPNIEILYDRRGFPTGTAGTNGRSAFNLADYQES